MENLNVPPVSTKESSARSEAVDESVPTVLHVSELSPSVSQIADKSSGLPKLVKGNNDLAAKGNASGKDVKIEIMAGVHLPGDKSLISIESITVIDKKTNTKLIEKKKTRSEASSISVILSKSKYFNPDVKLNIELLSLDDGIMRNRYQ